MDARNARYFAPGDSLRSMGPTWRAQVGYCSYCQRWLGLSAQRVKELSPPLEEAEWHWQQWVTEALGMVLALLPTRSVLPERQRVRQVVTHAVSHISAGEIFCIRS